MNIEILDQNFDLISVISEYESFIWTDRYNTPGDFEIYSPITEENLTYLVRDNYIRLSTSEHHMIIEDLVYLSDAEGNGRRVQVVGRSLESILDRRIVWGTMNVKGNMQDQVEKIFNKSIINPSDNDRKISNFIFEKSTDERITELEIDYQYTGNTLLEIVQSLAEEFDIGWKIILNDNKQFVFSFYVGTDRSFNQDDVPRVVFSPEYENVISSNYTISGSAMKNVMLVAGTFRENDYDSDEESLSISEDDPIYRTIGSGSGLLRREVFANATGIEQTDDMSRDDYKKKMDEFGKEEIKKYVLSKKFDGQYETKLIFKYGEDFFMGDTIEVADEFGNEAASKVIEFIWSNNTSDGEEAYPTFRSEETNEE